MPSILVALMVVTILLFGLAAVLILTKVMKAEVERVHRDRSAVTRNS